MNFQTAVRTCLNKYVTFSGRAQRSEYWWFILFTILVQIVASILDSAIFGGAAGGSGPLAIVASLGLLLPTLAAAVRRLHDQERTGWWVLIAFVPILGWIAFFVLMILKGTEGPNKYGPDPLA